MTKTTKQNKKRENRREWPPLRWVNWIYRKRREGNSTEMKQEKERDARDIKKRQRDVKHENVVEKKSRE
jgi:hypothetical protein